MFKLNPQEIKIINMYKIIFFFYSTVPFYIYIKDLGGSRGQGHTRFWRVRFGCDDIDLFLYILFLFAKSTCVCLF